MNKLMSKLTRSGSSHSMRSSSSRVSADMQVDVPRARVSLESSSFTTNILMEETHIHWRNKQEKNAFRKLRTKRFVHTTAYDLNLLQATGMDVEFDLVFRAVGWEGVWNVVEQGSKHF